MSELSTPPAAKGFATRIKSIAVLVTAVAGLVTAVASHLKPRDDSATKASYDALSDELKKLSEETGKQHDDLVSLKSYFDGYMRGRPEVIVPAASASIKPAVALVLPPTVGVVTSLPASPKLNPRPQIIEPASFADTVAKGKK